jgi:hypothetical protein
MRDFMLIAIGASLVALALAALGLNKAQTPNAAYSAAILGALGACILVGAAIGLVALPQ